MAKNCDGCRKDLKDFRERYCTRCKKSVLNELRRNIPEPRRILKDCG